MQEDRKREPASGQHCEALERSCATLRRLAERRNFEKRKTSERSGESGEEKGEEEQKVGEKAA